MKTWRNILCHRPLFSGRKKDCDGSRGGLDDTDIAVASEDESSTNLESEKLKKEKDVGATMTTSEDSRRRSSSNVQMLRQVSTLVFLTIKITGDDACKTKYL